jgi:hypothetical protein
MKENNIFLKELGSVLMFSKYIRIYLNIKTQAAPTLIVDRLIIAHQLLRLD